MLNVVFDDSNALCIAELFFVVSHLAVGTIWMYMSDGGNLAICI